MIVSERLTYLFDKIVQSAMENTQIQSDVFDEFTHCINQTKILEAELNEDLNAKEKAHE